ncbi:MAG TPA: magnesium transporter [Bacillus bacterium]|uniref:Magnesium transporter MgtE n=1 Tax=Siminovitchia fordii TaxID=254759 RepID=A0ABQ4KB09_9BACI|nr:magnesium transporter [Siminovitchia fordii]GIN22176.1 magnesium transporter MgtE [Siminovitchia fordii]HBZ09755.1 magnesium transporter [Bacillus sp. (in: firmicutes)]
MLAREKEKELTLQIIDHIKSEDFDQVNETFESCGPERMASIIQNLPERFRGAMLEHLSISTLASLIQRVNIKLQLEILSKIGPEKANRVLALLNVNFLSRLFRHYPKADVESFLEEMEETEAAYVRQILKYPENTAGSLMTNRYVSVNSRFTVGQAVEKLKTLALYSESLNHIYVVNDDGHLEGTVPYRDLIITEPEEKVTNIMVEKIISVEVMSKRSEIVRLLQRYDFTALPVVNKDEVLVGIITFDDMVTTIIHEAGEDISKISAMNKEIDFDTKPVPAAIRRLPWLIALLFIGLVSGSIISRFEETLEQVVALAFFMPLIAGMTGNTGTQSLAVVVRGLAEREVDMKTAVKLLWREFRVSLLIGMTCGLLIAIIAFVWQHNFYLGIVVGGSLFLTLIIGTFAGTIIPLILYKLKMDPAVASGPLITTVNDIFSLVTYFSIATHFLTKLT